MTNPGNNTRARTPAQRLVLLRLKKAREAALAKHLKQVRHPREDELAAIDEFVRTRGVTRVEAPK